MLAPIVDSARQTHKETTAGCLLKDEEDVEKVVNFVKSSVHSFETNEKLINLSSGIAASDEVQSDLLAAHTKGESAMQKFIKECITTLFVGVHATIQKLQLKMLSRQGKKKPSNATSQAALIKFDRHPFAEMAVYAQVHSLDINLLFTYSLERVQWSLANPDIC